MARVIYVAKMPEGKPKRKKAKERQGELEGGYPSQNMRRTQHHWRAHKQSLSHASKSHYERNSNRLDYCGSSHPGQPRGSSPLLIIHPGPHAATNSVSHGIDSNISLC